MTNIIDYIEKYGNEDFSHKEFNNVDSLIMAQLSYLKMDKIVPLVGANDGMIVLKDMAESPYYDTMFVDKRYEKENRKLFENLVTSNRFGNIRLGHHINLINKRWEMQFSAICCEMDNGITHVVFRGTDETFVGWKEDFNMGFVTPIQAQIKSVDYLNYVAERISGDFTVGGHSKGGNLAVYSAMKCPGITQRRIKKVYSFDGPGFPTEIYKDESFDRIKDRIIKIVPYASIVGMLLHTQEDYSVVECASIGLLQHNPFNWRVEDDDFIYMDGIKELYQLQNESIQKWLDETSPDEMKVFVNEIYSVFEAIGVDNLVDLRGNYAECFKNVTLAIDAIEEEHKEVIRTVFKNLFTTFVETVKSHSYIRKENK